MAEKPDWRQYEEQVTKRLRELAGEDATVEYDVKLPGRFSGVERQADALVTGNFAGDVRHTQALIDCKHYKTNVDVKAVEAFIGLVEDVNIDLGILITNHGYSPAAKRRAAAERGIHVEVVQRRVIDVVSTDEIAEYKVPYSGAHDEAYYTSDFYDHTPYGASGTTISYMRESTEDWEVLASDLDWADDAGKRECAKVILRHRLGQEPTQDHTDLFVQELAADWEEGQYWAVWDGELRRAGF